MINLPSGTVTFLFTDIEGSTVLAFQTEGRSIALEQVIQKLGGTS
jgi:hypothetical protein